MSDEPVGPDWWQASDGKWYHPQRAPGDQFGGRPPVTPEQIRLGATVAIIGGVIAVVAAFLPWATYAGYGSLSRNGFQLARNDGFSWNGVWTAGLGILCVLIGLSRLGAFSVPSLLHHSPIWPGIFLAGDAIYDATQINSWWVKGNAHLPGVFALGYGLYIAIGGGILAILGGVALRGGWHITAPGSGILTPKT